MIAGIVTMCLIIVLLFIPEMLPKKDKSSIQYRQSQYQTGYNAAMSCIKKGSDPDILYNQAQDEDDWDRGWQDACMEKKDTMHYIKGLDKINPGQMN